jgi:pilus assembly protein CpaC
LVTPEFVDPIPAGVPAPELKFPDQFLSPNTTTPISNPVPATPAQIAGPQTIAVEKLVHSMQPEAPLIIDTSYGPAAMSGSPGTTASASAH